MKTPHLFASFAVAATVSAAGFKDPAEVARSWDESTTQTKPLADDLSLRGTTPPPPRVWPEPQAPVLRDKPPDLFQVPPWSAPIPGKPVPREPRIDSPGYRVPDELPDNVPMPRAAKPWLYGGQTYWLMPLIPSRGK